MDTPVPFLDSALGDGPHPDSAVNPITDESCGVRIAVDVRADLFSFRRSSPEGKQDVRNAVPGVGLEPTRATRPNGF